MGHLPWQPLLDRLVEKTNSGVVRTDEAFGNPEAAPPPSVTEDPLFYEIEI